MVLEKNHVPGRKILSTGAGKCNFSNEKIKISDYCGGKDKNSFLDAAFRALPPHEIIDFFEKIGLLWKKGETGKLFPFSMKAQDVADVLYGAAMRCGAEIRLLSEAVSVKKRSGGSSGDIFSIETAKVPPQWEKNAQKKPAGSVLARKIILAAGSPCCPQIGGTDAGYSLAAGLGHSITEIMPSIVPFKTKNSIKDIDGVRTDVRIVFAPDPRNPEENAIACGKGEIIFAKGCISGPAVLECSRNVQAALHGRHGEAIYAVMDFFPDYAAGELYSMLQTRRDRMGESLPFRDFITGLQNHKLLSAIAASCGIIPAAKLSSVRPAAFNAFAKALKAFAVELDGAAGFDSAVVAAGGIDLREITPVSFESRLVPGLYITGEMLDIDGRTGGFNLHFAWTSGLLAAKAAAESLR